ncbi:MAG: PAS domain S-box protein [Rhodospirillaceae bacterium]|nr:PAS domain S-box protein [Rhodospirillaceae bacterium]
MADTNLKMILIAVAVAATIFIIDISLPLGVAAGVPYVALVLLGIWLPRPQHIYFLAILGSVLTIIGYLVSPSGGVLWVVLANRGLALFAIWITAILIASRKQAEIELRKAHDELEVQIERRTKSLTQEIAERKLVEKFLRESEERFRDFADGASDWLWEMGADLRFTYHSPRYFEITGFSPADKIGTERTRYVAPSTLKSDKKNWVAHLDDLNARRAFKNFEYDFISRTGKIISTRISGKPVSDEKGEFLGYRGTGTDITERKLAEEALRENEERFKDFTNASSDWFWEMGPDLRFTSYSQNVEEATGVSPDWLIGKKRQEQGKPEIDDEKWIHHLDALKAREPFKDFEYGLTREDGIRIYVRSSGIPIFGDDGNFLGYRGTGTNITRRKQTEAQLIQSSKMATLGEMATGMAHELNQPLSIIRMAAESMQELAKDGDLPAEMLAGKLERIEGQVDRASAIINHMRIFGRMDTGEIEEVNLKEAVQGAVGLLGEQLRLNEIELSLNLPETCREVSGHQLQLEQVILNLITNARDAIEAYVTDGNKLRQITISITDDPGSEEVGLSVQDTGGGIPDVAMERIFEPFFTTKEVGKGTGLGLSISYGIITEMGGRIEVANVDEGASFTVSLLAAK